MADIGPAIAEASGVRKGTGPEIRTMAVALARAFFDDPVFSWVLRGDPRRIGVLERGFELFLRRVWIEKDEVFSTPQVAGVAVWEPPGQWQHPIGEQLRLLPAVTRVFGRHTPRALRSLNALESGHPAEPAAPPHYYLAFLGVEPSWQGRGIGGALLGPVLERCDRERVPAYLESSTVRNRALYERNGFIVTEEFTLARGAPLQWRMWREPAADPAARDA